MDYERISVAIRERTAAEAVDVGLALARRHFPAFLLSVAVTAVPVAVACGVLLARWPGLAMAAFWWLLPACERLPLLLASRLFLGESPSVSSLRAGLASALLPHLAGDLSWRRLTPWRCYLAPVRQLEGIAGAGLSRRLRAVARSGRWAASGLAAAMLVFEIAAWLGALFFVFEVARQGVVEDVFLAAFRELQRLTGPLAYCLWVASFVLMRPFVVCAGFTLYINRRVTLEGWDIELVFRRMARRLARGGSGPAPRRAGAALALAAGLWAAAAQAPAQPLAQPPAQPPGSDDAARVSRAIAEVLADQEFGGRRQQVFWRPRWSSSQTSSARGSSDAGPLAVVATFVADAAPWVLGGGATVLLAWLLYRGRRQLRRRGAAAPGPAPLRGADARIVGPEPLPRDWPGAAARAWEAGDSLRALSLLYRGTLATIAVRAGIDLPASLTEGECVRRVRDLVPGSPEQSLLESAAQAWARAAYGQDAPERRVFDELRGRAAGMIGGAR